MSRNTVRITYDGDRRGLSRATSGAEGDLERLNRTGRRVFGTLGRAATVGGALIGAGLAFGLFKSAKAAIEAEKSEARLTAQLKAVGDASEETREKIEKVTAAQAAMSGFDDEDLVDSFTNILRVTGDVTEALELNSVAMDIARARQMDVAKAGELVGKVAGGNTGILSRYGIVVEKGATAQEALALLQEKFAGQAEEYGQKTQGSLDRAAVGAENLGETVGGFLAPAIAEGAEAAAGLAEHIQEQFEAMSGMSIRARAQFVWTGLREAVGNLFGEIRDRLMGSSSREALRLETGKIIEWKVTETDGLLDRIESALGDADWSAVGEGVVDAISTALSTASDIASKLGDVIGAMDWGELGRKLGPGLATAVVTAISLLLDPAFWIENWDIMLGLAAVVFRVRIVAFLGKALKAGVQLAFRGLGDLIAGLTGNAASRLIPAVVRFIKDLPHIVALYFRLTMLGIGQLVRLWIQIAINAARMIVSGIARALGPLVSAVARPFTAALGRIREFVGQFFSAARNIGTRIKDGVVSGVSGLAGRLVQLMRDAINALIDVWNGFRIPGFSIDPPGPGKISWGGFDFPKIPHLARGARNFPGGMAVVGDGGEPELVNLPRGSDVTPFSKLGLGRIELHFHFSSVVPYTADQARAAGEAAAEGFALQGYRRATAVRVGI